MTPKKKLIEVALPLDAINKASAREKSIRHGHPSTLHLWWARRPLAAARAVIFAQMVDDPSANPDLFPTPRAQEKERQRLFKIIEDLVQWENTTNEEVLQPAREEIWQSWRRACAENADHPRASELFDRHRLPAFHDPFAGGGSLPLEAQRLGLEAYASDLNPVAVLICKAMIEIPPKFAGRPPVNPGARREYREERKESALSGVDGLAEGDGSGTGSLPAGADAAAGGDVRDAVADNEGGRLDSSEYRGRMGAGVCPGEGAVHGDCAGLAGGGGDTADAVRGGGLVSGGADADTEGPAGRSQPNAHDDAAQVPDRLTLSPHSSSLFPREWKGAQGLAEDVRYYGKWMRDEAEKRIGHLYPKVKAWRDPRTGRYYGEAELEEMRSKEARGESIEEAAGHPSLSPFLSTLSSESLTVIAWLWARTVKSPNPAFRDVDVPLVSTFMLSTKPGKEAWVEVRKEDSGKRNEETSSSSLLSSPYSFLVRTGKPADPEAARRGTKLSRGANFECVMSGAPIEAGYIRSEAQAGRMGARLMAIVAEGDRGRVYLAPTAEHEAIARTAKPAWKPDLKVPTPCHDVDRLPMYGMPTWGDAFTPRQLVALTTFSDLVGEAMGRVKADAVAAGLADDGIPLRDGGSGATAYAEAVGVYLACGIGRASDYWNVIATWEPGGGFVAHAFRRQAIPMVWDFGESNPFSNSGGNWIATCMDWVERVVRAFLPANEGQASQEDAQSQQVSIAKVISTDPPYYDNIGYADLSDFFYVWLRRSLRPVFPGLFATLAVPKAEELVATPYRHGSRAKAESFFLDGMTQAMHRLAEQAHPAFPVTIYYAFKQSETRTDGAEEGSAEGSAASRSSLPATSSTGWETFLDAVVRAGFGLSGTWPMRTERGARSTGIDTNALASSIVLVCRPRPEDAPTATRREFVDALKAELPPALRLLQGLAEEKRIEKREKSDSGLFPLSSPLSSRPRSPVAPVDLAQAAIGPGMAVFTRYSRVLDAEGRPLTVREALALINQTLDEALAEQEGDYDADSRWAVAWFDQFGFDRGEFGVAETLSKAKNTSVDGMVQAGIVQSGAGKVRLLKPSELPEDWDPGDDSRLTAWETVHHLLRVFEKGGETAAAALVRKLGSKAETARELCYRLYTICERKKRAAEALSYNALVQSWPEIVRLAAEGASLQAQTELDV